MSKVDWKPGEGFRVPMSSPDLTEAERKAVAEVINTPRLSMGPYEEAFEKYKEEK